MSPREAGSEVGVRKGVEETAAPPVFHFQNVPTEEIKGRTPEAMKIKFWKPLGSPLK